MSFFLLNRMQKGRLRELRSVRREETKVEVEVPRRRRVVLGFSCGSGSRALRARAERAVLGFLGKERGVSWTVVGGEWGEIYICRSILAGDGGLGGRR